jgi:hypothetical protein
VDNLFRCIEGPHHLLLRHIYCNFVLADIGIGGDLLVPASICMCISSVVSEGDLMLHCV